MKYTENLLLRKPEDTDFASNEDLSYNADIIDQAISDILQTIGDISQTLDTINGEVI